MTVAYRGKLIGGIGQEKPLGATFGVRALLVFAIAACGASHASAQQELGPEDLQQKQKICGQVVSISCRDSEFGRITLLVDRILVSVKLESDEGHSARSYASQLLLRDVCAVGQLTRKGTTFETPEFTIANLSRITPTSEGRATDWVRPGVARSCDAGVKLPTVKEDVKPKYTREALAAGLQGAVWVEAIVETDGTIRDARVIRSLDTTRGLDAEALKAARRWRFAAATKGGEPTPMLVIIELKFSLKD